QNINLRDASLWRARLTRSDLSSADLRNADLQDASLVNTNLSGANLTGANLMRARLVGTNLKGANLTGCVIFGISSWDVKLEGAIQANLVVTTKGTPITVDDLEVAQFIYLLVSRQKLRNVITTLGEKAVLILGRFTERRELLDRTADKLRSLGYLPMIFD